VIEFHGEDSLRVKFAFCGEDAARGAVLTGKEKKRKEKKRKEKKRKEKRKNSKESFSYLLLTTEH
jgi:hypothetical protein